MKCHLCKEPIYSEKYFDFGFPVCPDCVEKSELEVDESFFCNCCEETFTAIDGEESVDYWKFQTKWMEKPDFYCKKCIQDFIQWNE